MGGSVKVNTKNRSINKVIKELSQVITSRGTPGSSEIIEGDWPEVGITLTSALSNNKIRTCKFKILFEVVNGKQNIEAVISGLITNGEFVGGKISFKELHISSCQDNDEKEIVVNYVNAVMYDAIARRMEKLAKEHRYLGTLMNRKC